MANDFDDTLLNDDDIDPRKKKGDEFDMDGEDFAGDLGFDDEEGEGFDFEDEDEAEGDY